MSELRVNNIANTAGADAFSITDSGRVSVTNPIAFQLGGMLEALRVDQIQLFGIP